MKFNIWGIAPKATLFATALPVGCMFAGSASAQTVQGKFRLQYSACWEVAALRAGNHRFTLNPSSAPGKAVITDATSRKRVGIVVSAIFEDGTKEESALVVGRRGNQHVIYSFRVAELGEVFVCAPGLRHDRRVREANNTETVRVNSSKGSA